MFTGLVEEVGRVSSIGEGEMLRLSISAGRVSEGARAGDSVSVNGACLTVGEVEARRSPSSPCPRRLGARRSAALGLGVLSTWSGRCPRGAGSEDTSCRGTSTALVRWAG